MNVVDLIYRVRGDVVRKSSEYSLYAALLRHWPGLRDDFNVRVGPLEGVSSIGRGLLSIGESARLRLRCAVSSLQSAIALDSQRIKVCYSILELHSPHIEQIRHSSDIWCAAYYLSSTKAGENRRNPERGAALEIIGDSAPCCARVELGKSRTIVMSGMTTHSGYAVGLSGISEADSIEIQALGIGTEREDGIMRGSKTHMGGQMWRRGPLPRRYREHGSDRRSTA